VVVRGTVYASDGVFTGEVRANAGYLRGLDIQDSSGNTILSSGSTLQSQIDPAEFARVSPDAIATPFSSYFTNTPTSLNWRLYDGSSNFNSAGFGYNGTFSFYNSGPPLSQCVSLGGSCFFVHVQGKAVFSASKLYRVKIRADVTGQASISAGIVFYNGDTLIDLDYENDIPSPRFYAAYYEGPKGVGENSQEYIGYFSGLSGRTWTRRPLYDKPGSTAAGATHMAAAFMAVITPGYGDVCVYSMVIEEVQVNEIPGNILGSITTQNASTYIDSLALRSIHLASNELLINSSTSLTAGQWIVPNKPSEESFMLFDQLDFITNQPIKTVVAFAHLRYSNPSGTSSVIFKFYYYEYSENNESFYGETFLTETRVKIAESGLLIMTDTPLTRSVVSHPSSNYVSSKFKISVKMFVGSEANMGATILISKSLVGYASI